MSSSRKRETLGNPAIPFEKHGTGVKVINFLLDLPYTYTLHTSFSLRMICREGFYPLAKSVLIKNPDDQLKLFKGIILWLRGVNDINKLKSTSTTSRKITLLFIKFILSRLFSSLPPKKYIKPYT